MSPDTFFRVLGKKPWQVAYWQPSRRPDDGRYGQNPNRVQKHNQFQVILKPVPADGQLLFLDSLIYLGVDIRIHDIKFDEDNWASPSLGAWGVGWQVMCDGLEITQFTYFQQAGGIELNPNSLEITYGVERLAMFLDGKNNLYDLDWGNARLLCRAETGRGAAVFHLQFRAGRHRHAARPVPAVPEGGGKAARAQPLPAGLRLRAEMLPCLQHPGCAQGHFGRRAHGADGHHAQPGGAHRPEIRACRRKGKIMADLLFELGVEEIPALAVAGIRDQLRELFQARLAQDHVAHGEIECAATNRRLMVHITAGAANETASKEETVLGPAKHIALDEHGLPTVALKKFCEFNGVKLTDVVEIETPKGSYLGIVKVGGGEDTAELLGRGYPGDSGGVDLPQDHGLE